MAFPAFFAAAPAIEVHDALAETLGASDDGTIEYGYADAVRVAGHSCPTVAGAWLMARAALQALYGNARPERGGLRVAMAGAEDEGTTGVIAQVFTLVTGAAADNGFHGLGGRFARRGLLAYAATDDDAIARFERIDNGAAVTLSLDLATVPAAPVLRPLMARALAPAASAEDRRGFAAAWQDRVRRLLLEHADDPAVILIKPA